MFMLGRDSSDEPHAHSLTGGFWADVLSLIKSPSFSLVTRGEILYRRIRGKCFTDDPCPLWEFE